jgi:hypothetical protein
MDIEFAVGHDVDPVGTGPRAVEPVVDGRLLSVMVNDFEIEHAMKPAGGYAGIVPAYYGFGPLLPYYLGRPEGGPWHGDYGIAVLGCSCGEVGCWPLQVQVQITGETVRWFDFVQPHRPDRDYSEFGPFDFDLDGYASAVESAIARLSSE